MQRCGLSSSSPETDSQNTATRGPDLEGPDVDRPQFHNSQSAGYSDVLTNAKTPWADCPVCTKRMPLVFMSAHLDLECSGCPRNRDTNTAEDVSGPSTDNKCNAEARASHQEKPSKDTGANDLIIAWEKRWDALGQELTCPVCLCLFVKPCTLPCQVGSSLLILYLQYCVILSLSSAFFLSRVCITCTKIRFRLTLSAVQITGAKRLLTALVCA